jgi:hypothetical protein
MVILADGHLHASESGGAEGGALGDALPYPPESSDYRLAARNMNLRVVLL